MDLIRIDTLSYYIVKSIDDLNSPLEIFTSPNKNVFTEESAQVSHLAINELKEFYGQRIYLKSSLFILVLSGQSIVDINFKDYQIGSGDLVILSFGHFFKIKSLSDDFRCVTLYIGKGYINEMYSTDMIYKRLRYDVRMHKTPILQLTSSEAEVVHERLVFIDKIVLNKKHRYYKELILSALLVYFLDLSHLIEDKTEISSPERLSRDEIYFEKFLDQLVNQYKTEHLTSFYAYALNITSHYLNTIVKRLSGQTVSDFVFQLLLSDAKSMLQQPNFSIQQIADELNFSDQSAFGKFFKRKAGVSPKAFRDAIHVNKS